MPITLSKDTESLIQASLDQHGVQSPDDLIRMALAILDHSTPDHVTPADIEDLDTETRNAINRAESQASAGQGIPLEDAITRLRAKHQHKSA